MSDYQHYFTLWHINKLKYSVSGLYAPSGVLRMCFGSWDCCCLTSSGQKVNRHLQSGRRVSLNHWTTLKEIHCLLKYGQKQMQFENSLSEPCNSDEILVVRSMIIYSNDGVSWRQFGNCLGSQYKDYRKHQPFA
jgi:hypothetical protein